MDRASQALHKAFLMAYVSYRALADYHNVARSTLHDRAHGQRSKRTEGPEPTVSYPM